MGLPTISHWIDTIANPHGRWRTLGELEAERDAYGNVKFTAGNNAAVFPVRMGGRRMMLKCYIREDANRQRIYDFVADGSDDLLPRPILLQKEAYVYDDFGNGSYRDVLVGEWVEGNTLDTEIRRAGLEFGSPRFRQLAEIFDRLAMGLLSREWAHGDLKPENIIIGRQGDAVLIDYDALFVPGCQGGTTAEIGTPSYQHPLRDERHYGNFLDDYPVALICASLHALALDSGLYSEYHKSDNIVMYPDEITAGDSAAYSEVLRLFASHGEWALYELALLLRSPSVEIPGLREVMTRVSSSAPADSGIPELFGRAGRWGYSLGGKTLVGPIFDEAYEFSDASAVVRLGERWFIIDGSCRMAVKCEVVQRLKPFGEGLAAFCDETGKWGYMDGGGGIAIAARFDRAATMHEGLAAVAIGSKTGFINREGQIVIPPVYDHARGFRGGFAEVRLDGEVFLIDTSGRRSETIGPDKAAPDTLTGLSDSKNLRDR